MAKTIKYSPPWSKDCHEKSADVIVPEQLTASSRLSALEKLLG